jgi:ABC-2 type transport system permease protein
VTLALSQFLVLSRRTIVNTFRQPTSIVPSLLFPLLFMAMSSAALDRSTALPGFPPVDSFMQFLIATTVVQGALFGSISAGAAMATDIEGGFFDRMIASPVARTSILAGRVMGAATLGFLQAWLFFGVALALGLTIEGGFTAMVLVALVAALVSAGIGSVSVAFGLRTGSVEAVQGSFPMLFAGLFLSSAFFPRNLMDGWFKAVADVNPLSHLIEGLRTQIIAGVDLGEWFVSVVVAAGVFTFGIAIASLALKRRLAAR